MERTPASCGQRPESRPLLLRPAQYCACCELASYPPPGLSLCLASHPPHSHGLFAANITAKSAAQGGAEQ